MAEYRVSWEIDIDADSPEEAARLARQKQLDPNSWATVFDVWQTRIGEHEKQQFDLTELDNERAAEKANAVCRVVHLEDDGQDFLRFFLSKDNTIVWTEPAQGWAWNGREVGEPVVGERLPIQVHGFSSPWAKLSHRVARVEDL